MPPRGSGHVVSLHPGAAAQELSWAANAQQYAAPSATLGYVAENYHAVRRQIAAELLVRALDEKNAAAGPVLEIGAGASSIVLGLEHLQRSRIIADASVAALAELKGKQCALVNLDANKRLPFADKSFAAVISTDLIEHLYDPMTLIVEFRRIVKPGGAVVLSTPNLATLQDRFRFLFGLTPRQIDPLHDYLKLHIRQYTVQSLRHMLDRAGFVMTKVRSNYVGIQLWHGRWLESRRLAQLLPGVGGSLIVSARRRGERQSPAHARR